MLLAIVLSVQVISSPANPATASPASGTTTLRDIAQFPRPAFLSLTFLSPPHLPSFSFVRLTIFWLPFWPPSLLAHVISHKKHPDPRDRFDVNCSGFGNAKLYLLRRSYQYDRSSLLNRDILGTARTTQPQPFSNVLPPCAPWQLRSFLSCSRPSSQRLSLRSRYSSTARTTFHNARSNAHSFSKLRRLAYLQLLQQVSHRPTNPASVSPATS